MTTLPLPHVREAGPDGMLERVAALLKGPKIEVCGMSDLEAALFVVANGEQDMTAANAALSTATSKLVQSGNLREKVLALYAQVHLAEIAAIDDAIAQRCKPGDFDCRIQTWESRPQVRAAVAEPLVKLALAGRDPDTYAAAAYACRGERTGVCASIGYAQWAKIEPDNAAVWLLLAAEASSRKDAVAHAEAVQRLRMTKHYDPRIPAFAPVFESEAVKTQPLWVQSSVGISLLGLQAATLLAPNHAIGGYCLRAESMDDARRTTCDAIANKLLETDENMFDLMMATSIGKKIGWDAAKLQALGDRKAVAMGLLGEMASDKDRFSCATLTRDVQLMRNSLSKGEMSIIRELIAKSGKTIPELAEKYRPPSPASTK